MTEEIYDGWNAQIHKVYIASWQMNIGGFLKGPFRNIWLRNSKNRRY